MLAVAIIVVAVLVVAAWLFAWRGSRAQASIAARLFARDEPRLRQLVLRDSRYPAGRHAEERVGRFAPVVGERVLGGTLGEYAVRGTFGGREFAVQVVEADERRVYLEAFATCAMTERIELRFERDQLGVVHPQALAADASAQRVAAGLEPDYLRKLVPAWFTGRVSVTSGELAARTDPGIDPEQLVRLITELLQKLVELAADLEGRERAVHGVYRPAPPPSQMPQPEPPTGSDDAAEAELAPGGNTPTHIDASDTREADPQRQPPDDTPLQFNR